MKYSYTCLGLPVCLASCSSTTPQVTTRSYDPASTGSCLIYYLPKTDIEVTATFDVYVAQRTDPQTQGRSESPLEALLLPSDGNNAVSVASYTVADSRLAFALEPTSGSWMSANDLTVSINDEGLLTAVNASTEDKTATVVSNTIGGILSAASLLKSTERAAGWEKTEVHYVVSKRVGAATILDASILDLFSQEMKGITDAADPRLVGKYGPCRFINPPGSSSPWLPVSLTMQVEHNESAVASADEVLARVLGRSTAETTVKAVTLTLDGVVYRAANPGQLRIGLGLLPLRTLHLNVADAGRFAWISLKRRPFSSRTDTIAFGASGAVSSYESKATSSAEALSGAFKASVDAVAAKHAEMDKAKSDAAAAKFANQRTLAGLRVQREALEVKIREAQRLVDSASEADKPSKIADLYALKQELAQLNVTISALEAGVTLP